MILPFDIQVTEVEPVVEPVTLAETKAWMKVEHTDDDALITEMNTTAREDIENELNVKLVPSSISFVVNHDGAGNYVLPVFPQALNISMASNIVINSANYWEPAELQVIDEDYYLNGALTIPANGFYLIEFDYVPVVSRTLKEAIKMLVAYRYNNRGDQQKDLQQGIPVDILRKISKYKQEWL